MKRIVSFFTCFAFLTLFLCMSASIVFAYSTGPIDGVTGSPADGGNTCNTSGCHNTYTIGSGSASFSISTDSSSYTLGTDVSVTVSFGNSSTAMHGFELSALDANDNHVGTLSTTGSDTQTNGDYIKHTATGNSQTSWQVTWTPESGVTDPVTFYAAGNEADGGGSPDDDYIYTASKSISVAGASVSPSASIQANNSDGPVTVSPGDAVAITISLDPGSSTPDADWWVIVLTPSGALQYYDIAQQAFVSTPTALIQYALFSLNDYSVFSSSDLGTGTYTYFFAVDLDMDGALDTAAGVFFYDSVSVTVAGVSFENDILPLFSATDGNGAWFNYGNGDGSDGPARACGTCHAGEVTDDGIEGDGETTCVPECHLLDLNTYAGWMTGADGGEEPILGESVVGNTDYDWSESGLKKRLRNNRMPPGIPFNVDETNRNGGDIVLSADADANDIALGGQFSVSVEGTSGRGEVEYEGTYNAIGLLSAYVDGLSGSPTTYAGSTGTVDFADIRGLFVEANVWYNGGLACTACHYCDTEPPCFHMIDFNTETGLLLGADGGEEPLLGESAVGVRNYNWGESGLRARLRNNRMPPNAPFDVNELTRSGPTLTHPITGLEVRAVDLIQEWVEDGAQDN